VGLPLRKWRCLRPTIARCEIVAFLQRLSPEILCVLFSQIIRTDRCAAECFPLPSVGICFWEQFQSPPREYLACGNTPSSSSIFCIARWISNSPSVYGFKDLRVPCVRRKEFLACICVIARRKDRRFVRALSHPRFLRTFLDETVYWSILVYAGR
jgi:hypothetical protein